MEWDIISIWSVPKAQLDYSGQVLIDLNRTFNVEVRLNPKMVLFHPNMVCVLKIADYSSPKALYFLLHQFRNQVMENSFMFLWLKTVKKSLETKNCKTGIILTMVLHEIKLRTWAGRQVITIGYQDIIRRWCNKTLFVFNIWSQIFDTPLRTSTHARLK